jgi:hypothetical protein
VKAALNEASQAALRRQTTEAKHLLLAEREGVLLRNFPETHDADSAHSYYGHAEALAAVGELTKSSDNKTKNC